MHAQSLLENYLHELHLPMFLQNYQTVTQDATRADLSYERYLLALCEAEVQQGATHRINRMIAQAKFPFRKDLASFDFDLVQGVTKTRVLELAQGVYMSKAETIILMGTPGLGKTHIALGLGLAACQQGKRVRFHNVATLVTDLLVAAKELRSSRLLATFRKLDLLILDELGFLPVAQDGGQLLFQLCSDLHERVSIIVTTDLRFMDWNTIFHDERMTAAFLDRLTFKSHILEFVGESYRFRQRMAQEEAATNHEDDASFRCRAYHQTEIPPVRRCS
jgi:DNA replication protein DnaC